jgi:hypothetical protein
LRLSWDDNQILRKAIKDEKRGAIIGAAFSWVGAIVAAAQGKFSQAAGGVAATVVGLSGKDGPTEREAKERNASWFGAFTPRYLKTPLYSAYSGPGITTDQLAQGTANMLDVLGSVFNYRIDLDAWAKDGFQALEYAEPYREEAPLQVVTPAALPSATPWGLYALGAGAAAGLALLLRRKLRK